MLMDKCVFNYFNKKLKPKYPELEEIKLLNPEIGKVKLISKNGKEWYGRIFLFSDKDYKTLTNGHRNGNIYGIDIDNIF